MSIADKFEVNILKPDGTKYKKVTSGAVQYVVAAPGEDYTIEVAQKGTLKTIVQVALRIDGVCPGISHIFNEGNVGGVKKWDSFLTQGGNSHGEFCTEDVWSKFKFSQPKIEADKSGQAPISTNFEKAELGSIVLTFTPVKKSGLRERYHPYNASLKKHTVGKLEGKKFFLAPSLGSEGGDQVKKTTNWSQHIYTALGQPSVLTLRYETATTLLLRNILKKDVPEHLTLLKECKDPVVRSLLAGPKTRDSPVSPEHIDLTKPVLARVKLENRYLDESRECAVCDLTDQDAKWDSKPKPVYTI